MAATEIVVHVTIPRRWALVAGLLHLAGLHRLSSWLIGRVMRIDEDGRPGG